MGTWGVKIFQNDDALDVKEMYTEQLVVGISDEAAEEAVLHEFDEYLDPIWLPLAIEQWKKGRLSDNVKNNALRMIEEEQKIIEELWKKELVSRRKVELIKAAKLLCSEMPERKKIRMPSWALKSPFHPGNVVQFKLLHDEVALKKWRCKYALLEVVGKTQTSPDKIPCEVISLRPYKWYSDHAISDISEISNQDIETIDFYYGNGIFGEILSYMPVRDDVKQHDMKCVCKTPLGFKAIQNQKVGNPSNATIDKKLALTLDYYFNL
jgi:hypothetical protein